MEAASGYESILNRADKVVELGREAQRENFGEDLGNEVDEAYGPVVIALREERE